MDASMTSSATNGNNELTDGQREAINTLMSGTARTIITEVLKGDKGGAQRLLENGDALRTTIFDAVRKLAVGQYANEETPSTWTYPDDYAVLPIAEQVALLQEIFPELTRGANLEIANGELPEGAEGWFAIVDWRRLGDTYAKASEGRMIPECKARLTKFYNYREGELSEKYIRQQEQAVAAWNRVASEQDGFDIFIVPAQFGMRHHGRSVRRAREVFETSEFGLGAFAVGCMLLTHPKRLQRWEQLHIDCAGDEYDWGADGQWADYPYFDFDDGRVEFYAIRVDDVDERFGSVSAFLGSVPSS